MVEFKFRKEVIVLVKGCIGVDKWYVMEVDLIFNIICCFDV